MANNKDYGYFIPIKSSSPNVPLQEGQFIINPETGVVYTDIEVFENDQDENGEIQRIRLNPTTSIIDSTNTEIPINGQAVANFVENSVDSVFNKESSRAVSGIAINDILSTLVIIPPENINTASGAVNNYALEFGLGDVDLDPVRTYFSVRNGEKGEQGVPGGVVISKIYNSFNDMTNDTTTIFPEIAFLLVLIEDSQTHEYTSADIYLRTIVNNNPNYTLIADILSGFSGESAVGRIQTDPITENIGEIFNDYNNNVASGNYSHAEGASTTASGDYSHAEGDGTIASGSHSHVEGFLSQATGDYSHAEGNQAYATGNNSHAESGTAASGESSHSEGNGSLASGDYSHAEGVYTNAEGNQSHAEGYHTHALGVGSHTEGDFTIANGQYQHVSGKYNIPDTTSAEIIGWGTATDARINIRTLDTLGNEWVAGKISVGNTNILNNSDLTPKSYVDNLIANIETDVTVNTTTSSGANVITALSSSGSTITATKNKKVNMVTCSTTQPNTLLETGDIWLVQT